MCKWVYMDNFQKSVLLPLWIQGMELGSSGFHGKCFQLMSRLACPLIAFKLKFGVVGFLTFSSIW